MDKPIKVRKAIPDDASKIADFNIAMAMETEGKRLKREEIEPGVKSLFSKPEYGFYIVAESGEEVIATLMITFEWSDWRNGLIWWIQSVYVVKEFRRKGVYRKMYRAIKEMAEEKPDVCGFRLYVEKENRVAQKTYTSLGMSETYYKIFEEI
ncbi:MAG: GNAT family N-acetyltransferase [Balneolaceae bacterium]|nr:GNAT family N-acetyltransferase [Balneolaceae bacterium]MCH8548401.1 GNAT family N-acetyltransferase [Balneolaceae bacterium]